MGRLQAKSREAVIGMWPLGIGTPWRGEHCGRLISATLGRRMAGNGHCARIAYLGGHIRLHVNRGVTNPNCALCL
jgi:hypothetical protein